MRSELEEKRNRLVGTFPNNPTSISVRQLTGAEEGGAGCGALPGGGVGVPHGNAIDVQIGGDSTGLNSNQVTSNT